LGFDTDGIEGTAGDVELIAQTDVDVGHLALGGIAARPLGQGFEQLLGGNEQVGDAFLYLRQLLLGLGSRP